MEELRGARWSDSREEGGATPGRKVEEPRGARWRNPGVQGGGQREHHETTRETQWGDFCKAVRELACCSALRRWATKNTRRESEAHAWEDAAVRHRRVAEVFGEVHASTRKRNVTLAAAGPDQWQRGRTAHTATCRVNMRIQGPGRPPVGLACASQAPGRQTRDGRSDSEAGVRLALPRPHAWMIR